MWKRLLTASLFCTAGTVGAVLLGNVGTPITATLLAAGATNSLISVLTGIIANDSSSVWDKIGDRLQGNDQLLHNDDLTKAVGLAISLINGEIK